MARRKKNARLLYASPPADPHLTQEAQQEALERFRILRPFLEDDVPLPQIAEHHGLALRTVRRWVRRYREQGLAGLARRARADKGTRDAAAPWQDLIEALALEKPRRTVAAIHRQVCEMALKQGRPAPGYSTVYDIAKGLDPGLVVLAHEGSKAYSQAYELLYRREAEHPNALWQADHSLLPILLVNARGEPARPWLTVIIDDYSRAVCGYFTSFDHPSTIRTALALRQAIWRKDEAAWPMWGIPQTLYTDHGSDFTSLHIEEVCAELKIRLVFSLVGQPRGRGRVERFFETVEQLFLMHQPGYAPADARKTEPVLDLGAFDRAFRAFVVGGYHHRTHSETGMTPLERWNEGGFLPQLPASLEQLDVLLLTVARPRQVRRDGIHFQGFRYIDPVLAVCVGEAVTVRYDPRDLAEIRVYQGDNFLCRAVCQELAGETVSLQDVIRARRRRKRELRRRLAARRSLLDVILERPVPSEALPAAGGGLDAGCAEPQSGRTTTLKRYENE